MGPLLVIGLGVLLMAVASNKARFERALEPVLRTQHEVGERIAFWRRQPRSYERFAATVRVSYLIGGVLLIAIGIAGAFHEWFGVA